MSALAAIVLGIVQGLTEFLPISSSAHLRIVPALYGGNDPGAAFTAIVQLGTMLAVLIYFRQDLWRIGSAWLGALRDRSRQAELEVRMGWYLIIATIPISVLGLAFKDAIETKARNLTLIACALIVLAVVLYVADRVGRRVRTIENLQLRDGVVMGLAQALALIPGVSRSGATITAGLFLGLDRPAAARFSFLLSIPAVVLSGLFELKGVVTGEHGTDVGTGSLILATVAAFVVGYASIAFLLRYLINHTFTIFVIYRIALGVLVLSLLAAGLIN